MASGSLVLGKRKPGTIVSDEIHRLVVVLTEAVYADARVVLFRHRAECDLCARVLRLPVLRRADGLYWPDNRDIFISPLI